MRIVSVFLVIFFFNQIAYSQNQCAGLFSNKNVNKKEYSGFLTDTPYMELVGVKLENLLIRQYQKYAREFKQTPDEKNFASFLNLRTEALRELLQRLDMDNLKAIKKAAFLRNPKAFTLVRDMDFYSKEYSQKLLEEAKTYSRIIVTTAVAGRKTNLDALNALLNMAEKNHGIIWVIPAEGKTTFLDPVLLNHPRIRIVTHSVRLAYDLVIRNTNLSIKAQNPLASLERDGNRGETAIYGSTKIHSRSVATRDNNVLQHLQYTTGTISEKVPFDAKVVETKSESLEQKDHMYGAIILEKTMGDTMFVDNLGLNRHGKWNVRISRFSEVEKGFSEFGNFYTSNGEVRALTYEVYNPGDLHILKTDPVIMEAHFRMLKNLKGLKYMVAHDPFDGRSVSHWEANDFLAMTLKAQKGELNVLEELYWNVAFYNRVFKENKTVKVVIPPANHNDWLSRWIRDQRFLEDPYNREIGMELFEAMKRGLDPYEYFILKHVDKPERMIFVRVDQSFKVGPDYQSIDLANHGDKGANGARGSMKSYQVGYDSTMYGHTHRYEEKGLIFNIGTSTYLALDYSKAGLNSWVQAVGLVDQYGQTQVLIFKNGEWIRTKEDKQEILKKEFFEENMPQLVENPNDKTDQNPPRTTFEIDD